MKVFLISGKAGHGKTTFGEMLEANLTNRSKKVLHLAFGNAVKDICQRYFDYNQKDTYGRHILQTIGTDVVRKSFPDYWVELVAQLCRAVYDNFYEYDAFIVSDARFQNEIDTFYKYFDNDEIVTIRVERTNEDGSVWENPQMSAEAKSHSSENSLDDYIFDYVISHSILEQLEDSADTLINLTFT